MVSKRILFAVSMLGALGVGAAHAQNSEIGKALYMENCAACHGENAKGDGDMADVLKIPAPNLTLLSKNNGGTFPMLKVIGIIDGRTEVQAHGRPMPLFGRVFMDPQPMKETPHDYQAVVETRGRLMSLALYLYSIQAN